MVTLIIEAVGGRRRFHEYPAVGAPAIESEYGISPKGECSMPTPSIWRRLRHARTAVNQGLPTVKESVAANSLKIVKQPVESMLGSVNSYLETVGAERHGTPEAAKKAHLYECLTIIDGKAQALLSFNSFLLAIVGIYFGAVADVRDSAVLLTLFLLAVAASGTSCLLCLDVIWLHWVSERDLRRNPVAEGPDYDGFVELLLLRDERTRVYRVSWILSFIGVSVMLVAVIITMIVGLID